MQGQETYIVATHCLLSNGSLTVLSLWQKTNKTKQNKKKKKKPSRKNEEDGSLLQYCDNTTQTTKWPLYTYSTRRTQKVSARQGDVQNGDTLFAPKGLTVVLFLWQKDQIQEGKKNRKGRLLTTINTVQLEAIQATVTPTLYTEEKKNTHAKSTKTGMMLTQVVMRQFTITGCW